MIGFDLNETLLFFPAVYVDVEKKYGNYHHYKVLKITNYNQWMPCVSSFCTESVQCLFLPLDFRGLTYCNTHTHTHSVFAVNQKVWEKWCRAALLSCEASCCWCENATLLLLLLLLWGSTSPRSPGFNRYGLLCCLSYNIISKYFLLPLIDEWLNPKPLTMSCTWTNQLDRLQRDWNHFVPVE